MIGRIFVPAIAALAATAPSAQASAPAPPAPVSPAPVPPVTVPSDLQALEQKMLALQLTSERFSVTVSVAETPKVKGPLGGFDHIFGRASSLAVPLITAVGEANFVPPEASFTVRFLGITTSVRMIGSTLYTHEPYVARLDGGRPWVEERNKSLAQALGSQPSAPGGSSAEPGDGFKGLVALIAQARSIVELGPATVDGQVVNRFRLSVPIAALQKPGRSRKARARARLQHKQFDSLLRIELFLAETGLPVRTNVVVGFRHDKGELIAQSDVTAVNVPVLVQAPPAAETIAAGQLHRLLRRRARRLAAKRHVVGRRIIAVRRGETPPPKK